MVLLYHGYSMSEATEGSSLVPEAFSGFQPSIASLAKWFPTLRMGLQPFEVQTPANILAKVTTLPRESEPRRLFSNSPIPSRNAHEKLSTLPIQYRAVRGGSVDRYVSIVYLIADRSDSSANVAELYCRGVSRTESSIRADVDTVEL